MPDVSVLTGATGYLGSHLAIRLLESDPLREVVCIARSRRDVPAVNRILNALEAARAVSGLEPGIPPAWSARLHVVEGALGGDDAENDRLAAAIRPYIADGGRAEIWHCAAATMFTELQEGAVFRNNVGAAETALHLARRLGIADFQHVSTAYVSGTTTGVIPEQVAPETPVAGFNNVYEESKYACERLVAETCAADGRSWRILRPSIIIGHSQTRHTGSRLGFYYFLDIVRQFHSRATLADGLFFRNRSLKVRVDPEAVINLIPVDVVVDEMRTIAARGTESSGRVYHITNPEPLAIAEMIPALCSVFGISHVQVVGNEEPLGVIDALFNKKMALLNPYVSRRTVFDRANVLAMNADRHDPRGVIGPEELAEYSRTYLDGGIK